MGPVGRRVKSCNEGRMLIVHVFSRVGWLKVIISAAQLHLDLGCNHVLPGLALLDMERRHRSVTQDSQRLLRRQHTAVIGDQGVRTAVCRQGREEDLQHGCPVVMRRRPPGPKLPRIAFDQPQTRDPAALELDEVAHIRAPQVLAVRRALRERCEAGHVRLRITGTLPGTWGPMALAIDGHGAPHGALTRGRLLTVLPQSALDAKPAGAGIRLLEVSNLFETGQAQLILGMRRRPCALILQACDAITLTRLQTRLDMRPRELEAVRHPLCVPPCRRHPDDRPARLVGIGAGRAGGQSACELIRGVRGGHKPCAGGMLGRVATLPLHHAHHCAPMDGGIELFSREDRPRTGVGIAGRLRLAHLRPPSAESVHPCEDKAPGFVAHPGPLHPGLPPALCRRVGEEHKGPHALVSMLDGIDKLLPNVGELFLR
jgi:hypothetical protein